MRAYLWTASALIVVFTTILSLRALAPSRPALVTRIRQIGYWGGVASIFGLAAWLRWRVPVDPIADPDIWGYLSPALRKLTGAEFGHTAGRNFLYPGFLFLLLRGFGDFRAISVAQHFSGLVAGALLLLTWRRARIFASVLRVGHDVYNALGLLAIAMFLWSVEPIHAEMQIRPEGISAFLISINLYLLVEFVTCSFIENRRAAAVGYGITAVCSSIMLASVKPSFVLAAILALLPTGIFFFRKGWFRQKIALAGGAAVSAALLLLPEHFLNRNDETSRTFLPTTLFVIHANLIRDQMAEDIERGAKVPYPPDWLKRVHKALNAEIAKSGMNYFTLGFNPDYLMYDPTSIAAQLRTEFGNNVAALCAFYRFYYWRILKKRPAAVLRKVAGQMDLFYASRCPAYRLTNQWPLTGEYVRGFKSLEWSAYQQVWSRYQPAVDFMDRTRLLSRNASSMEQSTYIGRPLRVLAYTYRPLLLVVLAISTLVLAQKRYRHPLGWVAILVLFLYSYNFTSCLEVAVIHSLQNPRYVTVQLFPTMLAQFVSVWFILEFVLRVASRGKPTHSG